MLIDFKAALLEDTDGDQAGFWQHSGLCNLLEKSLQNFPDMQN